MDTSACQDDFERLCPDAPASRTLYLMCFMANYSQLSEVCRNGLMGNPAAEQEKAYLTCQDNTSAHSSMLSPPASAQEVHFMRCGVSDKVTFHVLSPYPDESLANLFIKRWEGMNWLPNVHADPTWQSVISKDRRHVARERQFIYENSKGQLAFLTLAYYKTLDAPLPDTLPVGNLDMGKVLHVQASLSPVRRTWDNKLPKIGNREILVP
jgi:hypothetical protein